MPWRTASELSRLRPKRPECLVRPDAQDAIFFFPDAQGHGSTRANEGLHGDLATARGGHEVGCNRVGDERIRRVRDPGWGSK